MSRYQPDHYDVCDTIKLECGLEFCPDHDEQPAYVPNPEDFDPRFPSYLHDRGLCAECDSCWTDVDANIAYNKTVTRADGEDLTVTVEELFLVADGDPRHKVRIASSDNKTTHWLTAEQAQRLAAFLTVAAAQVRLNGYEAQLDELAPVQP